MHVYARKNCMKLTSKQLKEIFVRTIPIMTGYIVLGMGFGIYASKANLSLIYVILMSVCVYAGSMQYVLIELISSGAGLLTTALTTFMVNARHFFYGISMIEKYDDKDVKDVYSIFALTDETYSLVCSNTLEGMDNKTYYFYVSLFDQIYWILGTVLGSILGNALPFSTDGIEFSMTALFITVFVEQWLTSKNHLPALTGLFSSILCLIIFGQDSFLIPSMIMITVCLFVERKVIHE